MFLIFLLCIVVGLPITSADSQVQAASFNPVGAAVNYLAANYNKTIGLIHESPEPGTSPMAMISWCSLTLVAEPLQTQFRDTYNLYSDNFLASLVLWNYDPSNSTLTEMAQNITNTTRTYLTQGGVTPINQWMVLAESMFAFNASKGFIVAFLGNGATIKTRQNNQTSGYLTPQNYADVAFEQAIYYHQLRKDASATAAYRNGTKHWDGLGFRDCVNPNGGTYATYKLALYIYCSKLLGVTTTFYHKALSTLLATQNKTSGGFRTSYDSNLQPTSGTNTETTSTAILALNLVTLHQQSYQELSYSVKGAGSGYSPPIFQANQIGLPVQLTLSNTVGYLLCDYGSTWTVTNPLVGSTSSERWFTTQATSGTISASSTRAFSYQNQFYLTMSVSSSKAGTVAPSSGWNNAGSKIAIKATAKSGHKFKSWAGTGTGSYTGTGNPATITMNSVIAETATFS